MANGETSATARFTRRLADPETEDAQALGPKAATLGRLRAAGFPVPDGFVVSGIDASDLRRPEFRDEIASALDALGPGPVAVRSSAVAEDLPGASFAGLYESVLGVEGLDAVVTAIDAVMRSAASERVAAYRPGRADDGKPSSIAVLVQRMVQAEIAGVAFTADPVSGERDVVVVSAVRGLGDRLVSGEAGADEWIVRAGLASRRRAVEVVLEASLAVEVADLARRVEAVEGRPQDIEWALESGRIHLLQARAMTALPEPASWDSPVAGAWSRDFRLGEWLGDPVTPLFESWLLTRIEDRTHRDYADLLGIEPQRPGHVLVNGWYFYGLNFMPARPAELLGLMLRHVLPRLIRHPRRTAIAFPPLARFSVSLYEREWRTEIRPGYRRLVADAEGEVSSAAPERLVALVDALAEAAGHYFTAATMVAGYASKAQLPLARFHSTHLAPIVGGSHLELLEGLGDAPPVLAPHAVRTLDWVEPTVGEGTNWKDSIGAARRHAAARTRRLAAEGEARATLSGDPKMAERFGRLLADAQHYAIVREDLIGEFTLPWPVLRAAVLRLGASMVELGAIETPGDVFFLRRDEVTSALSGGRVPGAFVPGERRGLWERQRKLVPPLRLGAMPPMIRAFVESAERTVRGAGAIADGDIVGIPASAGRAFGPARVVRSAAEFGRIRPGDVLVAPMTAPAWTAVFDRVAAIVTDTGGVAAHASLVAREYGIPAVVGTTDATARLRDGDLVEVDGSAGIVRLAGTGGTRAG